MKKFEIIERYVSYARYTVEAENEDEALEKFHMGEAKHDPYWYEADGVADIEEINEIGGEDDGV